MSPKQRAAEAAIEYLKSGMIVGLGTGSTAEYFHQALADAIKDERLRDIKGIPTSRQAENRANQLGIPLVSLTQSTKPDVTVDGADEVDPALRLIKGLGGALLREKIVAQNSKQMVVIADSSKLVVKLGTKGPLPVEVAPFAHDMHEWHFKSLGATPVLRRTRDGTIYETDNGNYIYDCKFDCIDNAEELEMALQRRAGVVGTGLFIGIATVALIADEQGVTKRERK